MARSIPAPPVPRIHFYGQPLSARPGKRSRALPRAERGGARHGPDGQEVRASTGSRAALRTPAPDGSTRYHRTRGERGDQYVLTLLIAFGAAAFLTSPAPSHRVVFRCDVRTELVTVSNRLALVGLVLLMLAMSSSLLLVVTMVLGAGKSAVLASVILSGVVWLWIGMPLWCRVRHRR
ncbi:MULTISPECIES: DUF6328 family protein [unclassified Streptomyces]|uniref:DUF6328 family protein n=1 Tax=unclassified Streptomyces TaxID=2593676 RepID=UPI002E288540|nr:MULTISPECIES: DUF6328 family protein [unclassified Streptomyces]